MKKLLLFSCFVLALASCSSFSKKKVSGDGNIQREIRKTGSFSSVAVSGALHLHLVQDPTNSVRVETDKNLLQYVQVQTVDGQLEIRTNDDYNLDPTEAIRVYISAPAFESIEASGACTIISDKMIITNTPMRISMSGACNLNLETEISKLVTTIAGSGEAEIRGRADSFEASIHGAGSIKALELTTQAASISISGSGDAAVTANQRLNVDISGSGDVKYKGNAQVDQSISGSGSVKKI